MSLDDPVLWVELAMLSALLTAGFCAAWTDLRFHRVPNRYTWGLLGTGVAGRAAMAGLGVGGWNQVAGILLLSLAVALLLTLAGVWLPGDAKMYWASATALPPSLCPVGEWVSLETPPAALLANALVAYGAALLAAGAWRQRPWRPAKGNRGPWLQAAAGLGALLGLALSFAQLVLNRPLSYLEALAFLVVGYRLLEWGLEPERRPVVVIPGLAALALLAVTTGGWSHYVLIWGAASLVELAFQQVRQGSGRAFGHKLPVGQLRPGAVLRHRVVLAGDDGAEVVWEGGESLDQEAVELLQKRAADGDLPDTIELTRTMPVVPFLVAGALATAVFGGHLAPPLRALIVWLNG